MLALVTAIGPLLWLVILVVSGLLAGDPMRVFNNHLIWQDEYVSKVPGAIVISAAGGAIVFWEILTEKPESDKTNQH